MSRGKINLLFLMIQMEMGGSERLIHRLACGLDPTLFNPHVAWFHGGSVHAEFKALGIPLHHLPKTKRVDFTAMRRLARVIDEHAIDAVNAHHFQPLVYAFYGTKIAGRAKLVYTEHSEWEIRRLSRKARFAGRWLLGCSDAAVGVSSAVTGRIRETFRLDPAKTHTITNGIDDRMFEQAAPHSLLRSELGIGHGELVVGCVANFKKVKNHLLLLEAFRRLLPVHPNARLLLVGRGFGFDPENSEQDIRAYLERHGLSHKVLLTGFRSDVPALLQTMDIFCLPSQQEGLPLGLIEAMAAGLPVAGTDVEGIRDVVVPGRNGMLVPRDDPDALKQALAQLLASEAMRTAMGRESAALAKEKYSLQQCIKQYEMLFQSLVHGVPNAECGVRSAE